MKEKLDSFGEMRDELLTIVTKQQEKQLNKNELDEFGRNLTEMIQLHS